MRASNTNGYNKITKLPPPKAGVDAYALTDDFPYLNGDAAREAARRNLDLADEESRKPTPDTDHINALLDEAFSLEYKVLSLTGDEEHDKKQCEEIYIFEGQDEEFFKSAFGAYVINRTMDALEDVLAELEQQGQSNVGTGDVTRGFTSHSGTDKTENADRSLQRIKQIDDNKHKAFYLSQFIKNATDIDMRLDLH